MEADENALPKNSASAAASLFSQIISINGRIKFSLIDPQQVKIAGKNGLFS